ncbi:MAG TPA: amino acid deaminase/aldolase [Solirubrobacteraceae bacterium]|nr:amino acid deaminase/aldolase [Solirubrobacteraceae bacterium]
MSARATAPANVRVAPPSSLGAPQRTAEAAYARLERATAELRAPFALIDLDAFDANARDLERRAGSKPIRLASKSLRCRAVQDRALARDGFQGTLAFTLPEALWLAERGVQDIVVAYPTADEIALRELAERSRAESDSSGGGMLQGGPIAVMIDSAEQLPALDRACAVVGGGRIRVCLDIDSGWRALAGKLRVGVKRSPAHTPQQAGELARAVVACDSARLVGVMMYEAQIAGVGDDPPGRPWRARAIRAMQALSGRELPVRRAAIVAAVQQQLARAGQPPLELVNGGGTGSLERTSREDAVSEVTAGSGLYAPGLFDSYRAFTPAPAALFALPIVRRPGNGVVTALGGGYLASGPGDRARLPHPYLPAGLRLDREEGAGEVQTPLLGQAADRLALGDRVYLRHAKAGELCERFSNMYLLQGDRIVDEVPTYRGEGVCFL